MPFLLNEDRAIKKKVQGMKVHDTNEPTGGRVVESRFVTPETELADVSYPLILIFYQGLSRASEREHRGPTVLPYTPEGAVYDEPLMVRDHEHNWVEWDPTVDFDPTISPWHVQDHPIPYNIDYRIEIRARYQQHLVDLVGQLAIVNRLPERFGYLEVEEDATVRSLDLLGGPVMLEASRDNDGKRLFRAAYAVRVAAELDVYATTQIHKYVETVDIDLYALPKQG